MQNSTCGSILGPYPTRFFQYNCFLFQLRVSFLCQDIFFSTFDWLLTISVNDIDTHSQSRHAWVQFGHSWSVDLSWSGSRSCSVHEAFPPYLEQKLMSLCLLLCCVQGAPDNESESRESGEICLTTCACRHALILTAWNSFQTSILHLAAAWPEISAETWCPGPWEHKQKWITTFYH